MNKHESNRFFICVGGILLLGGTLRHNSWKRRQVTAARLGQVTIYDKCVTILWCTQREKTVEGRKEKKDLKENSQFKNGLFVLK